MFRKVMVPLDGSPFAQAAIAAAAQLAQQHAAELHLVFVNALGGVDGDPLLHDVDEAEYLDHRLQEVANATRETYGIAVVTAVPRGAVIEALSRYTERANIDLIMMATHGRTGLTRAVTGSFADDLMHAVHVPLILLRVGDDGTPQNTSFRRTLVALDGSAEAEDALTTARAIATVAQSTLILAQVVVPVPIEVNLAITAGVVITDAEATQRLVDAAYTYLEGLAAEVRTRDGLDVEVIVDIGMAVSTLAVAAGSIVRLIGEQQIDLVVLTTRERRGSRLLLRSVADRVLHETRCTLLLCHGQVGTAGANGVHHASASRATHHFAGQ